MADSEQVQILTMGEVFGVVTHTRGFQQRDFNTESGVARCKEGPAAAVSTARGLDAELEQVPGSAKWPGWVKFGTVAPTLLKNTYDTGGGLVA